MIENNECSLIRQEDSIPDLLIRSQTRHLT